MPAVIPARSRAAAASTAISCVDIHQTYHRCGFGPATAKFIALVSRPRPDPARFRRPARAQSRRFGLPAQDDGSRNDPLVGQNIMSCNHDQHDFDALRAASTRVVIAVAAESSTMIAGRAAVAVAERLGTTPVTFPGGRDGFPGGEYGRTGDPDAFAATLRQVLTSRSSPSPQALACALG